MAGFFDADEDPESIKDSYIEQVIPDEARELWLNSIESSLTWDQYSAYDQMTLADMYSDAVFGGNYGLAEEFLFYLDIVWDSYDIHAFYEAYEALTRG